METPKKIPSVLILDPVAPTAETVMSSRLKYANLDEAANKHRVYDASRMNRFFDTEQESVEEGKAARQWALQNLLMTAQVLNATESEDSMELWSRRYTQASSEIYGEPEPAVAIDLARTATSTLLERAVAEGDTELAEHFQELAHRYGILDETPGVDYEQPYSATAAEVKKYYEGKYGDVFEALSFDDMQTITPGYFADKVEAALAVMTANHDSVWSEVAVVRDTETNILKPHPSKDEFIVGMQRASMAPLEAKGLFAHEMLVHMMRRMNGRKISSGLEKGLYGYLDSEEGLGVIAEYALTGVIPEKNVDRYVDIALALGHIDGQQKTRQELIDFAGTRALLRNGIKPEVDQKSRDEVMTPVHTHVNRIYRGSLGDNHIGIFTKDITYQKGFTQMMDYIGGQLSDGRTIDETMDYLLQGKFDPTNPRHIAKMEEAKS